MDRKIYGRPILLSRLIRHVDIQAFTGKRNRVFCIILVLSPSCALSLYFCVKRKSSFGNNVLRPSLTSFHFPSLPIICDCIPFGAFKSVFNRKVHSKKLFEVIIQVVGGFIQSHFVISSLYARVNEV